MKRSLKMIHSGVLILGLTFCATGIALGGEEIVLSGTISVRGQITDDGGSLYEIVEIDAGKEIIELVSRRVTIVATIADDEGTKLLTIYSYEVILTGKINEKGQLVDDTGTAFDIEESFVGNNLMELNGHRVTVKGKVEETEGLPLIIPSSYKIISI